MGNYRAEDLTPGMVIRGSRGTVTLGRRLPNRKNKRGAEMVRFECSGVNKTFTSEVGSLQIVYGVPPEGANHD